MASDEIQGLSVKIDVTDELFTQGISKINQSMKLLKSEFKSSSEGLKGFGNDMQQLANKQDYLNKAIKLQEEKVKQLREAYNKSKNEAGEFANSTMKAGTKVNNAVTELNKMKNELKDVDEALEKSKKEVDENSSMFDKLGDKVKKSFDGMGEHIKKGFGMAIGGDLWNGVKSGMSEVLNFSNNLQKSLNSLQAQTGATGNKMGEFKQVMLDIYNDNFGESFEDISQTMATIQQQTGATGDKLKGLSENALLLRDTFDTDVNESVRSANMLMQQFGLSGDEAYNLIIQGAQNGLNKNDDLLDTINEYSVHFKQLGFDADDMFNILNNGAKSGTFSVDKLGDAVKEFGIRVKDGTADDAFAQLGLNADELKTKFNEGGEGAKQALEQVTQALFKMDDPVAQTTLGVQMFGTMWEDLGRDGIQSLTNLDGSISKTKDSLEEMNKVKYNDIGSAFEGIKRNIETGILVPIGDKLLPKLNDMGQWFVNNMPQIKTAFSSAFDMISPILDVLGGAFSVLVQNLNVIIPLVGTFGSVFAAVKISETIGKGVEAFKKFKTAIEGGKTVMAAFNVICNMNPISLIVIAIGALVAILVVLYQKCTPFREFVNWIASSVVNFFTVTLPQALQGMVQLFSQLPAKASALWQTITQAFQNGWNAIVNFFTVSVPQWIETVGQWFLQLPEKIAYALGFALGKIVEWGGNVINWITTNVPQWINNIITFFSELPGKIWDWLVNAFNKITEWGSNIISWIGTNVPTWIDAMVNFFATLPEKIWNWLVNTFNKFTEWGGNMISTAKQKMSECGTSIVDGFKNLPSKMLEIGKNIVAGIKEGIKNAWNSMTGWIGGLCSDFVQGVKDALDIHSPSRVFRDQVGRFIPQGIQVGIEAEMPNLNSAFKNRLQQTIDIGNAEANRNRQIQGVNYSSSLDKLAKKLDKVIDAVDIKLDGDSIVKKTAPRMSNQLAFNTNRRKF